MPPPAVQRPLVTMQADFSNDGAEVDWDEEAKKLGELAKPMNEFYKAVSSIEAPELIREFAKSAPDEVQFAVKTTVASLLGNLPASIGESAITTTGKNLATLMFNMQMTGYMFRNAEYRRSLVNSFDKSLGAADSTTSLPPVSGKVSVKLAGIEAEIDAAAYMAELRSEVEDLRMELARTNQQQVGSAHPLSLVLSPTPLPPLSPTLVALAHPLRTRPPRYRRRRASRLSSSTSSRSAGKTRPSSHRT